MGDPKSTMTPIYKSSIACLGLTLLKRPSRFHIGDNMDVNPKQVMEHMQLLRNKVEALTTALKIRQEGSDYEIYAQSFCDTGFFQVMFKANNLPTLAKILRARQPVEIA